MGVVKFARAFRLPIFLVALALSALTFFAVRANAGDIATDLESRGRENLFAEGHEWAQIIIEGHDAHVYGFAPSERTRDEVLALVDDTWGVRVTHDHTKIQAPVVAPPPPPPPPPAPPPPVDRCQAEIDAALSAERIEFLSGRANLRADSAPLLQRMATLMKRCPNARVRVEGHTDSTGRFETNSRLSKARARAVRTRLVELGVADKNITSEGYGADRPLTTNDSAVGRAQNRRIEIRLEENK